MKQACFFMSHILLSSFIFFNSSLNLSAQQIDWTQQLYDSIYLDKGELIIDIDNIKASLSNGANPNWIFRGKNQETSILGKFVRDISVTHFRGLTPERVSLGTEVLRLLFQNKAKLQSCDRIILFYPISSGHYEIVKLLLEHGADARSWPKHEIGSEYELDPIEEAAKGGYDQIVDLLISHGAKNPSNRDILQLQFVNTAIHGTVGELKELLKKGARINEPNRSGETALMNSLKRLWDSKTLRKIEFLLDSGADPNAKGKGDWGTNLPLHSAVITLNIFLKIETPAIQLFPKEILETLISKGAFISGRDDNDKTPLHVAAKHNNLFAAQLLLDLGAKVNPKDQSGKTPFDYAESREMILILKEHGATE